MQRVGATPYEPMLDEKQWEQLKRLPHQHQQEDVLQFLWNHAAHTPTRAIPGKLKELHGEHKGLWQFDIDQEYRVLYRVDEDAKQVLVEYIGYHPDWGRRSSGGRKIRR